MTYRTSILFIFSLILTGCLLKPYEKPPEKMKVSFNGAISLVDLITLSEKGSILGQAEISGKFIKPEESPKPKAWGSFRAETERSDRAIQCQLVTEKNPPSSSHQDEKSTSVGKLFLGTPTSSQGVEIPEVSPGIYQKELLPHFAPGIYFLKALGKETNPPFMIDFSMPEEVRGVMVNNHSLEEGPAVVQKSSDFLLEIDPVTAPNDMNIIEVILISENEQEKRALVCGVVESALEVINGKTQLTIPSAQLSGLFASPNAALEILRVNAIGGVLESGPSLRVEGIRAWTWPSWIAE